MDQAGVAAQVGAIWQDELAGYPLWALHNATRWWLSRHNPDRRKKPLPGDISARCEVEMMLVRIAQRKVDQFDKFGAPKPKPEPEVRKHVTDEERDRVDKLMHYFANRGACRKIKGSEKDEIACSKPGGEKYHDSKTSKQ